MPAELMREHAEPPCALAQVAEQVEVAWPGSGSLGAFEEGSGPRVLLTEEEAGLP